MRARHALDAEFLLAQTALICRSYQHWTGRILVPMDTAGSAVEMLMQAEFAVLSHDTRAEPVFNYANLTAQRLFKMDWATFTQLPSRLSAEPVLQAERERFLQRVAAKGYIDDYSGIRIASDGSKFLITHAVVWNLLDEDGVYHGQAAMIPYWQHL
jgi:hypothetical protein